MLTKEKNGNKFFFIIFVGIIIFSLIFMGFFNYYRFGNEREIIVQPRENDHILGDLNKSKVYLIEYSDFECSACALVSKPLKELKKKYGEDLAIIYRHFPLIEIHPHAFLASQAAEAAGLQNKFWEYHDILFEKQNEWSKDKNALELFKNYAKSLNLDINEFEKDLNSREIKQKILEQRNEALKLGLQGTPSIFINGKLINLRSLKDLEKEIKKYLSK